MENMTIDQWQKIESYLKENWDSCILFEEPIDQDVANRYTQYLEVVLNDRNNPTSTLDPIFDRLQDPISLLEDSNLTTHEKEIAMVLYSSTGDIEHFRFLQSFIKKYSDATEQQFLVDFAVIAMQHARMTLEMEYASESSVYVSSPLGSKNEKIRYSFEITAQDPNITELYISTLFENELKFELAKNQGDIELINIVDNRISGLILVPALTNPFKCFERVITNCNECGPLFTDRYKISNSELPMSIEWVKSELKRNNSVETKSPIIKQL